jgi:hypothetical protein
MHLKYLGDSFDIVKKSLLQWLGATGSWSAHPMFTGEISDAQSEEFSRLIGVPLVSRSVLAPDTDRTAYFAPARSSQAHLFLDPDTGVRLASPRGRRETSYIYEDELLSIVRRERSLLTLVYDQSVPRGGERASLESKLQRLATEGISGAAYVSHACFLLLSQDASRVSDGVDAVVKASSLPRQRFLLHGGPEHRGA